MKKYTIKPTPENADYETKMKIEIENAKMGLEVLEENASGDIKEIIKF